MSIASEITRLQTAKASLKTSIEAKGVTVPSATTLDGYAALVDTIQTGGTLQSKSVTPTESTQTVTPDSGYDGLSSVSVGAISSSYVGSGVTRRSDADMYVFSDYVIAPNGYYAEQAWFEIPVIRYYTGTSAPNPTLGGTDDVYLQIAEEEE